jgi:TPR repeat protein
MFFDGDGVEQDAAEAVRLYRLAAVQDHDEAQVNLGSALEWGIGTDKSKAAAIVWYQQAAKKGVKEAIENLKRLHAHVPPVSRRSQRE